MVIRYKYMLKNSYSNASPEKTNFYEIVSLNVCVPPLQFSVLHLASLNGYPVLYSKRAFLLTPVLCISLHFANKKKKLMKSVRIWCYLLGLFLHANDMPGLKNKTGLGM